MAGLEPVLWVYATASVAALIAFAIDKRRARLDRRRIPERNLHMLELLGGWPGALVGIFVIRHKSRKFGFLAVTALIVILHATAWFFWLSRP